MSAAHLSPGRRRTLLAVILLGTLLGPLDSAVNIAFPDITTSFAIELKAIRWVIIAYVATYASLMLIFGRLGDLFGHHRMFAIGLMACMAGFGACALATSYNALLLARILQGIGTAMVLSCGPALATSLYTEAQRPKVLGLYAMMFGLGGAVGPSFGGLLVGLWGWPAVFWFRLPLAGAALALMIVMKMPAPPRDTGRFDLAGSFLLAVATGLLLLTFSQLQAVYANPVAIAGLCAATAIATIAFTVVSKRAPTPVLDLKVFSSFPFSWINITNVVVNCTGFATMLFVPYFLVRVTELPLWQCGLVMAVGPLGMMLAANLGGLLIGRVSANRLTFIGSILVAAGLAWISFWDDTTSRPIFAMALLVHGSGLGLFQVASLEIVARTLPITNRGVAGSLTMVMRTIGVVIAASTLTIVFANVEAAAGTRPAIDPFVAAFQTVFWLAALTLATYIAISALRLSLWFAR